jgi:hypothetical protein
VGLAVEGSHARTRGVTRNLSSTGALIQAGKLLDRGSAVRMEFKDFKAKGEVVWSRRPDDEILLGVKFVSLGWRARRAVDSFLQLHGFTQEWLK